VEYSQHNNSRKLHEPGPTIPASQQQITKQSCTNQRVTIVIISETSSGLCLWSEGSRCHFLRVFITGYALLATGTELKNQQYQKIAYFTLDSSLHKVQIEKRCNKFIKG
jgi:hypothetical protein